MNWAQEAFLWISCLIVASGVVWAVASPALVDGKRHALRWALLAQLCIAMAWLWGPWLAYGVRQVHRWNIGNINDMERETIVLPPEDRTRPSKAESND